MHIQRSLKQTWQILSFLFYLFYFFKEKSKNSKWILLAAALAGNWEVLPINQFIVSNTTAQMFKNTQKTSTTKKVGSVIPVLLWVTAGSAAL